MNRIPISPEKAFPFAKYLPTFAVAPSFFALSGPGTLVRLVQLAKSTYDGLNLDNSRTDGAFWFEEDLLSQVVSAARTDLMTQQAASQQPFSAPFTSLVGLYVRHYLRGELAVSKDWTNDFDGFVSLRLDPGDKLIALVGPVARQPAYSSQHPQHGAVLASKIWLEGQAMQYVIDFTFPDNQPYTSRIAPFVPI